MMLADDVGLPVCATRARLSIDIDNILSTIENNILYSCFVHWNSEFHTRILLF
jgi:hypothetical protein